MTIGSDQPLLTHFPISFGAHLKSHELSFDPITESTTSRLSSIECQSPVQSALSTLQRDLFIIPLQAGVGITWQDSVVSTICNGSLAIRVDDLRSYKIIAETDQSGSPVFTIHRTQKTLFSGEGSQDQHQIKIKGESLGTGLLYADRLDGSLISLTAETKTNLQLQTSGRSQLFIQTSKETVKRN